MDKRIIVGVIAGHFLGYTLLSYYDKSKLFFWIYVTMNWSYLLILYIYTGKKISKKWIDLHKWLIPIATMTSVILLPAYVILLFKYHIALIPWFYLYVYRITLVIELPLTIYLSNKINSRLSNSLQE
jgi:hypothetical protein